MKLERAVAGAAVADRAEPAARLVIGDGGDGSRVEVVAATELDNPTPQLRVDCDADLLACYRGGVDMVVVAVFCVLFVLALCAA